jgi:capsular polysaccharide biosynthesis protein
LVDFLLLDRADKNFLENRFISPILGRYQADYNCSFVTVDKPTLFRHVKVPSASVEYATKIFKCHERAHVEFANATLDNQGTDRPVDRVYLSRSALSEKLRHVTNEDILEKALAKSGYTIVYPERLSLEAQLKIFNTAKWIVGTIDSAFHTSLFSTERFAGSLAILSWSKINRRYLMIDAIKGNRSTYVNCITMDEIDDRRRIQKTSLKADVALDALSSIGAI